MLLRWAQFSLLPDCKIQMFIFFGFYDQIPSMQRDGLILVALFHSGKVQLLQLNMKMRISKTELQDLLDTLSSV